MKKELGLLLAGVASFDLGTVVVAEAAQKYELQDVLVTSIASMSNDFFYLKLNMANASSSANSCMAKSGKVVRYKGTDYCQIPKTGSNSK